MIAASSFFRSTSVPQAELPTSDARRRRAHGAHVLASTFFSVGLLLACGGGAANSAGSSSASGADDAENESYGESSTAPAPEPVDPCASGTCTHCGEAVCLSGFYCEESESSCGWLPQCASDLSCDCIGKVLTDCSCEEREGGVYLTCE